MNEFEIPHNQANNLLNPYGFGIAPKIKDLHTNLRMCLLSKP